MGRTLVLCILALSAACTGDFEKYNKHPTDPSPTDLTVPDRVGTLFSGMLYLMHNSQENDNQMIEQMVGNQSGGYMATTNNWQGYNYGTFNPTPDWTKYPFDKLFTGFYGNYFKVKELTQAKGYIFAWANIVRVAVMLRATDTYGPIPYSKMGNGELAVKYDRGDSVYLHMIDDLDASIITLTGFISENSGKTNPMAEYDVVYNGDFARWIRFANSIKLRMAVRMATNVADVALVDYAKQVMADAVAGGCIESNGDNAFLPTNDNPYRKAAFDWGDLAINATLSAYMNGWNDPRLPVYMTRAVNGADQSTTWRGVRTGIVFTSSNKETYSSSAYSKPNFSATSPMLVFCAAETKFLKAEAVQRGWLPASIGTAQSLYQEGITTSMEQHNVSIGTYLNVTTNPSNYTDHNNTSSFNVASAQNGGAVTVAWSNATTDARKLEAIITQKWLAMYPLGFEAWCDFRRTSYPRIIPSVTNLNAGEVFNPTTQITGSNAVRLIRRLPYPVSEYNGNHDNVEDAVTNLLGGADTFGTNLWWARQS
jgi:hypothetical protein